MVHSVVAWVADELLDECPTGLMFTVDPMSRAAIDNGWRCRHFVDLCRVRCELVAERTGSRSTLADMVEMALIRLVNGTLWRQELTTIAQGSGGG